MTPERNPGATAKSLACLGLIIVVSSVGLALGAIMLGQWLKPPPTPQTAYIAPTATLPSPPAITAIHPPDNTSFPTPTAAPPLLTITIAPCAPPPVGWLPYTIQSGDTLYSLAARAGVSQQDILKANCAASPNLLAGQRFYLPPMPTPSPKPCVAAPPSGWILYTVRAGDTLYSLATTRGATPSQVTQVNCLPSPSIRTGQMLYLPPLAIPSPLPTATTQAGPFTHQPSNNGLPPLKLAAGGPNDPDFVPCALQKGAAWISVASETQDSNDLQLGQRAYYFACEFPDPSTLTAWIAGPGGAQLLEVLPAPLNPDLQMGQAQRAIGWNAACDLPPGSYSLTIADGQSNQASLTFNLNNTTRQRILTVPQSGPPGATFKVYYCGYPAQADQQVAIDFYYEAAWYAAEKKRDFEHAADWLVTINSSGWGQHDLPSLFPNPAGAYLIQDREGALKGWDMIWLTP